MLNVSVALVIQHAKRTRRVILYHIFPHYLINGMIFGKQLIENVCFDFLKHLSETSVILRIIHGHTIINVETSSCKGPVILATF